MAVSTASSPPVANRRGRHWQARQTPCIAPQPVSGTAELRREAGAAAPGGAPSDLAVRHALHISAHGALHFTVALVDAYRGAVGACHVSAAAGVVKCIRRSTSQQHTVAQQAGMVARVHAESGFMQHRSGDARGPGAVSLQARPRLVCVKLTIYSAGTRRCPPGTCLRLLPLFPSTTTARKGRVQQRGCRATG